MFGVDYSNTFAPVARLDRIKLLFALAAQNNWKVFQLDVKSVFLNGFLKKKIVLSNLKNLRTKKMKTMCTY